MWATCRRAPIRLMVRIDDDFCGFSLDASGEPLHKRGHKEAVGKAPMRVIFADFRGVFGGHQNAPTLVLKAEMDSPESLDAV